MNTIFAELRTSQLQVLSLSCIQTKKEPLMPTVAIAPKEDLPLKRQLASGMSLLATILLIVTMINLGPSIVFAAGLPDNLVTNPSLEEKV